LATVLELVSTDKRARRVLFVDDSRLMRYAGNRFLAGHCEVVEAQDGREAWQRLLDDPHIDLVFTDLMMPVMDGHELIHRIRRASSPRLRQLPVLVVTGNDELAARELALSEGATDFIAKPFSPDDLRQALQVGPERNAQPPRISGLPEHLYERPHDSDRFVPQTQPDHFCLRLEQTLSFHQRQQLDLSLLHVQFRAYWHLRDRYGPRWGDAVMRNIERILIEELRQEDSIHRTAPDLFSVILMATGRTGARILSSRLRRRLSNTRMRFTSMVVPVHTRFAVQFPDVNEDTDAGELLKSAQRLLHWRTSQSGHDGA